MPRSRATALNRAAPGAAKAPRAAPSARAGSGGRRPRSKGDRIERQIVAIHAEIGIKAERVPLSGAARYQGNGADIDVYALGPDAAPLVGEVKARADGAGFALLERWLSDADVLFLRRDRAEPLIVLPWSTWTRLLARTARVLGMPPSRPLGSSLTSVSVEGQVSHSKPEKARLQASAESGGAVAEADPQ